MRNAPDCWLVMTLRSSATVKTARTSVIVVPERIAPAKAFWRLKRSRNPKKAGSLARTNAKKNNGIRTIVFGSAKRLGMSSLTPVRMKKKGIKKPYPIASSFCCVDSLGERSLMTMPATNAPKMFSAPTCSARTTRVMMTANDKRMSICVVDLLNLERAGKNQRKCLKIMAPAMNNRPMSQI